MSVVFPGDLSRVSARENMVEICGGGQQSYEAKATKESVKLCNLPIQKCCNNDQDYCSRKIINLGQGKAIVCVTVSK